MTDAATGERSAGMLLRLSGGAIGYASTSSRAPHARRPFEVQGTRGSLVIRNTYAYLSGADEDPRPTLEWHGEDGVKTEHFVPTEVFRIEVEHFNHAITHGTPPATPGRQALRALMVSEAAYASVRTGQAFKITEI